MKTETLYLNCPKCGEIFEAPTTEPEKPHQCPACKFPDVRLTKPEVSEQVAPPVLKPPTVPESFELPHAVEKRETTAGGVFLRIIGWLIIVPTALFLFSTILAVSNDQTKGSGRTTDVEIILVVFEILVLAVGGMFLEWAKRTGRYWICSKCGNRLSTKEARMCGTCKAQF